MNERAALPKLLLSIESSCDETAAAIVSQNAEVWSDGTNWFADIQYDADDSMTLS